jgi:peptidoglycan/xylan/chitin deacetylase (PgdA/CDA1 family)
MKKIISIAAVVLIIAALFVAGYQLINRNQKINGLIMLIEFEKIEGILNWEKELDQRCVTALVKAQGNVLAEYPAVFKRLADKGYEIAGGYDEAPFWDMPYNQQYLFMQEAKDFVENITDKPMRVFGSRYFAYDENTLKAADALGIEYVLARGTAGEKAVIYQPEEYSVKIISVSNIPFEDMGSGSLCDYSLWARGAEADDFDQVLAGCIAKNPDNMILVSHAYLGGTRLAWWNIYQAALESDKVFWKGFDDWMKNLVPLSMANEEIPFNREVKYEVPAPKTPIEELEPISESEKETIYPACY